MAIFDHSDFHKRRFCIKITMLMPHCWFFYILYV